MISREWLIVMRRIYARSPLRLKLDITNEVACIVTPRVSNLDSIQEQGVLGAKKIILGADSSRAGSRFATVLAAL
jgi:hypothetical protein